MRQTENFKLSLFDGSDPVSMAAMNANTEAVDAALQAQAKKIEADEKSNAEQFGLRAKIATGSYIGATATAVSGANNTISTNYGTPKSSSRDLVFTVPFVPRLFLVAGMRSMYFSRTVSYITGYDYEYGYEITTSVALSGYEYQCAELAAIYGSDLVQAKCRWRYPYARNYSSAPITPGGAGWESTGDDGYYAHVTFTENDDGTCTVTIHGTDSARATENYLDIEGVTYHWVAIG